MSKRFYLIFSIGALVLLGVILMVILPSNRNRSNESPVPTPFEANPSGKTELNVVGVVPPEDTSVTYLPVKQISITFDQKVRAEDILVSSSPKVERITKFVTDADPNTVIITAQPSWNPGITTITLIPGSKSLTNGVLRDTFKYRLNTAFPENPPPGTDY